MTLRLYDTLTRAKRDFVPLDKGNVRMYVCGPTVYDFAHIGNARPVIVFDVLFRLLRHLYGEKHVTYVRNITDVDDKIIERAAQGYPDLPLNAAIAKVTAETEEQFHDDVAALGCLPPTVEPRATAHIDDMKVLIEKLVTAGCAYVAEEHVLFYVPSMSDYGELAKQSRDEMIDGARVEVAPYKRDAMDFVLWKPSKPGEPAWPSPCDIKTPGRPGWHIECSAMADRWLWTEAKGRLSENGLAHPHQFDIHGGGIDLVFPHHENEVAQSRCAFHTPMMASFWLYNGFLQVEGEKMSKSLGNFVTIRELLEDWKGFAWPGEALRFNMLRTRYQHPINWTFESLDNAHKTLWNWYKKLVDTSPAKNVPQSVLGALYDDLNTPLVITELHRLYQNKDLASLLTSLQFLGFSGDREMLHRRVNRGATAIIETLLVENEDQFFEANVIDHSKVQELVNSRNQARKNKNFTEADRIRDELAAMGVVLKDSKDGTTWEVAR